MLVGLNHAVDLPFTLYGKRLLAKLVLFGVMLGLAATSRFRLAPALEQSLATGQTNAAVRALRISLTIEKGTAVVILALIVWLGMIEPP